MLDPILSNQTHSRKQPFSFDRYVFENCFNHHLIKRNWCPYILKNIFRQTRFVKPFSTRQFPKNSRLCHIRFSRAILPNQTHSKKVCLLSDTFFENDSLQQSICQKITILRYISFLKTILFNQTLPQITTFRQERFWTLSFPTRHLPKHNCFPLYIFNILLRRDTSKQQPFSADTFLKEIFLHLIQTKPLQVVFYCILEAVVLTARACNRDQIMRIMSGRLTGTRAAPPRKGKPQDRAHARTHLRHGAKRFPDWIHLPTPTFQQLQCPAMLVFQSFWHVACAL